MKLMFTLKDINLVYDLGKEESTYALRDVNIVFPDKGLIGIIGPSGSGKSSLINIMSGLKTPTSGEVFYGDQKINQLSADKRASLRKSQFGIVFQRGYLVDYLNVCDNVLVPVNNSTAPYKQKAKELLKSLGIGGHENKKPYKLSGGQRQRVSIARGLIASPKVLFADEPTAALDHASAREVMEILAEYAKENLVLIVTHDMSILDNADRVIKIWDGRIETEVSA